MRPQPPSDSYGMAIQLREERGWSITRIARNVGCSKARVHNWLLRAGVEKLGRTPTRRQQPERFLRSGRAVIAFLPADDAELLRLEAGGLSFAKIAQRMSEAFPDRPRRASSVASRLRTLARHEAGRDMPGAGGSGLEAAEVRP